MKFSLCLARSESQPPDGVEHSPTGMNSSSGSWKPNPRKVSTGRTQADCDTQARKVVSPLIANKDASRHWLDNVQSEAHQRVKLSPSQAACLGSKDFFA